MMVHAIDFAIYEKKALLQSKAVQPKAKEHQQLGCVRVCAVLNLLLLPLVSSFESLGLTWGCDSCCWAAPIANTC
jgi:hypothetical protein